MPTWSLSDTAKIAFKVALYVTFMASFLAFTTWIIGFINDTYTIIQTAASAVSTTTSGSTNGLLGCVMHALALDAFLTSFISIFFSAGSFWLVAVAYIHSFKFVKTGYNMLYKATT